MTDKKRILIVDDEAGIGMMMKFNLETTHQYEVCTETDPLKAIETALEFKPNLIFLDLVMPGVEGSEVARKIENHPSLKNAAIVFLSGMLTEQEASISSSAGHRLYLVKPIDFDNLMECAQKYAA